MRPDIIPGAVSPDYELTDHTRTRRRLSELQGNDPMILILSRGHYCPKDHQQHLELAAFYPKIAVAYTKSSRFPPIIFWKATSFATPLARNGHFSQTQAAKSSKTSTFRSTPTPSTIP